MTKIALTFDSPNRSKVSLKGSGMAFPVPTLPIEAPSFPLTVQLSNSDTSPICWESVFDMSTVEKNAGGRLEAAAK